MTRWMIGAGMSDAPVPDGHNIIVTRYFYDEHRNRKRIKFRCEADGCSRGTIETIPASAVDAIVAMLQAEHNDRWTQQPYLKRGGRQT